MSVGFVVDTIPNYLVIPSCCYASANSEYQFPIECFLQQFKDLVAFFVVWQIGCSMSTSKVYISPCAWGHRIAYYYSADVWKSIAMSIFVNIRRHCAWWLISNHRAVDAGADWALDPLFLSLEHSEARFMNEMTTSEGNDVLIIFFYKFILVVLLVLKLKLANAALIMRRFFSH